LQKIQDKKRKQTNPTKTTQQVQQEESILRQQILLYDTKQQKNLLFQLLTLPESKFGQMVLNFLKNWKDKAVLLMTEMITKPEEKKKSEPPHFFSLFSTKSDQKGNNNSEELDFLNTKKEILLFKDILF
jgi:hypothetical protein